MPTKLPQIVVAAANLSAIFRVPFSPEGGFRAAIYTKNNADNQPVGPEGPQQTEAQIQVASLGKLAVSTWRVHSGDDPDTEETEFGHAESRQSAIDQRL